MGKINKGIIAVQSKGKFLGQGLLLGAVVLNLLALMVNVYLSNIEATLAEKKEDERYFFMNYQAISAENIKRVLMHGSLNQQKILRRLGNNILMPDEKKALLKDEAFFESSLNASLRKRVLGTYLQAHDLPAGTTPEKLVGSYSAQQLVEKLPELDKTATEYIYKIKNETIAIREQIVVWKRLYSSMLILSTILIIFANKYLFDAAKLDVDLAKTT